MPAVAPIPPGAMKTILELYGWKIAAEDGLNWVFVDPSNKEADPVVIPKIGDVLALDVMMQTLIDTKMDLATYFSLKQQVLGKKWNYDSTQEDIPEDLIN